ncbi:hypothetical protein [Acinetobacter larvae]|uniref:Uncharacterized protein n=1 Tax=Acinetobacter larvae TaxID=1789224 RepID=A0A1B2LWG0_9GAMM|nr:hypothetical protein [Acinetobacter larvae]AOA57229.1 hypothetical protein BFG52_01905 [Acinetobacter larvae]
MLSPITHPKSILFFTLLTLLVSSVSVTLISQNQLSDQISISFSICLVVALLSLMFNIVFHVISAICNP